MKSNKFDVSKYCVDYLTNYKPKDISQITEIYLDLQEAINRPDSDRIKLIKHLEGLDAVTIPGQADEFCAAYLYNAVEESYKTIKKDTSGTSLEVRKKIIIALLCLQKKSYDYFTKLKNEGGLKDETILSRVGIQPVIGKKDDKSKATEDNVKRYSNKWVAALAEDLYKKMIPSGSLGILDNVLNNYGTLLSKLGYPESTPPAKECFVFKTIETPYTEPGIDSDEINKNGCGSSDITKELQAVSSFAFKEIAKTCFVDSLNDLEYLKGENPLSSLNIIQDWLPKVHYNNTLYDNVLTCLLEQINGNRITNCVLFSEPGTGKTYSVFATIKTLLAEDFMYGTKLIVPVFLSSLLLSINKTPLLEYISSLFYNGDQRSTRNAFQKNSDVHFILFLDAINESINVEELIEEIIALSHPLNKNVSIIVSSNNKDEDKALQCSSFDEMLLDPLDMTIVDAEVESAHLSSEFKVLLTKPFYLERYLSDKAASEVNDEYSLIDAYIENCKTNGKIVRPRDSKRWSMVLDEELPNLCYDCAITNRMHVSIVDNQKEEYRFLDDYENTWRLIQSGIIKQYAGSIYFEHENYRNYFAAKYLFNKCVELCTNPNAPQKLKTESIKQITRLLKEAPANVCALLSPKLYNLGLLNKLLIDCRPPSNDIDFYKTIIHLFSFSTKTLDGLDFSEANLWITDFTKFDRIINCSFKCANVNPETIWLHHAKISYSNKNRGRIKGDLVFLSGAEGFEVYNWKDDRQLFIRFPEKQLPIDWGTTDSSLIIKTSDLTFCIQLKTIIEKLHANTDLDNEEFLVTKEFLVDESSLKRASLDRPDLINKRGDELNYSEGKELYVRRQGRAALTQLSDKCHFATFVNDDTIFADCNGVYIIISIEGVLLWKRMIKPVMPNVISKDDTSAIIEMNIPGTSITKLFKYVFSDKKSLFLYSNDTLEKQNDAIPIEEDECITGLVEDRIEISDNDNNKHCIFGGAIDFTDTIFEDTMVVSRPIDEREQLILEQFGGIVIRKTIL